MEAFTTYIARSFGTSVTAESLSKRDLDQLPLYLKGNFNFFKGQIEGRDILWAKVPDDEKASPEWLQNQGIQLKKWFPMPIVFVFDHLDAWQRNRFIERKVGFVQTHKQLYIPEMLLQLSDIRNQDIPDNTKKDRLSFPAQCAILYHLQNSSLDDNSLQQIAEILHYSNMTVTRIVRELQGFGLISVQDGRERHFRFNQSKRDLWDQVFALLSTPVKEVWFLDELPHDKNIVAAGETALAYYSMLSESPILSVAIGKEQFKSSKALDRQEGFNKRYGNYKMEVWNYDPQIIAGRDSKFADKLSLYLSLPGAEDERVRAARDQLLKGVKW